LLTGLARRAARVTPGAVSSAAFLVFADARIPTQSAISFLSSSPRACADCSCKRRVQAPWWCRSAG